MSETMLERAAKAAWLDLRIALTGWDNPAERAMYEEESGFVLDTWPETHMSVDADGFRSAARAALMAIREPSERITKACCWNDFDVGEWQSGIDEILQEKPE